MLIDRKQYLKKASLIWILFMLWSVPTKADTLQSFIKYSQAYNRLFNFQLTWAKKGIVAIVGRETVPNYVWSVLVMKERQGIPVIVTLTDDAKLPMRWRYWLRLAGVSIYTKDVGIDYNIYVIDGKYVFVGQKAGIKITDPVLARKLIEN